ncbi:hypothetical protein BBK36DRAFT_1142259 [Trichoderma citrinoviride]|uniref:RRM domain-containing protein n=1 Tax=Trichoderma citrinoviride TaxID=58853 RepID=A0A2T4B7R5_9HYPO|nr:hypothetical protein BBK36DRAFT_1142259 [Trichoderma citrinoviride]PTB65269.1 hypothetical protein BBK36DRAFT_1142259 [Trichoderma citrinoviride]
MPNRHMFPTSLKDVQPGNETGDYHITFCNLAFNTTWQEMKDWISASCSVDYIEVFPSSCSGWIRVKGKDNFEKALAHLRSERFKDRSLLFDSRNEIEAIKIKCKETSPKPKHARRKRSTRGPKMLCEKSPAPEDRRAQSPPPYTHTWSPTDHVHAAEVAERRAYEEYLAFASLMFSTTSLQGALQIQYPPVSAFPYYQAEYYNGMGMDYYGNPFSAYSFGASPDIHPAQLVGVSELVRAAKEV